MPLNCEICGSTTTTVKASFDGTILNVCRACSSAGKIIEQPKQRLTVVDQRPIIYQRSNEDIVQDFGKIISKARQQIGLKQEELATKLNEKLSVIQAAEQGKRLDLGLARKLEKFLKIKLIEII